MVIGQWNWLVTATHIELSASGRFCSFAARATLTTLDPLACLSYPLGFNSHSSCAAARAVENENYRRNIFGAASRSRGPSAGSAFVLAHARYLGLRAFRGRRHGARQIRQHAILFRRGPSGPRPHARSLVRLG